MLTGGFTEISSDYLVNTKPVHRTIVNSITNMSGSIYEHPTVGLWAPYELSPYPDGAHKVTSVAGWIDLRTAWLTPGWMRMWGTLTEAHSITILSLSLSRGEKRKSGRDWERVGVCVGEGGSARGTETENERGREKERIPGCVTHTKHSTDGRLPKPNLFWFGAKLVGCFIFFFIIPKPRVE